MKFQLSIVAILLGSCVANVQIMSVATAQELSVLGGLTLEEVKAAGALRSSYRKPIPQASTYETPQANLQAFHAEIEPILKKSCYKCHGSETAEGEFRVDTLDPDLLHGEDVSWWLEVSAAVNNGEMPPEEGPELADDDRIRIVEWLSSEIQIASQVRRAEQGQSSFRRMTRYEYNYALQDLLGLELDFARDLPPDPVSGDGFKNSSEVLQMTGSQYHTYFQKASLKPEDNRGGLLTQAGLLAMNSDGTDSNPLKRGVWLLESILNDPPPPPPPAVPEIDLADPEILKMTLKERMEDHRNQPACFACHAKIDPWGIAFENFDAVGSWRAQNRGKDIDASSLLFNQHELDGVDGLKRYLLVNRQDQFARAIVHKMLTFALGRPLTFGDRASVDRLTSELRKEGDGLATLVTLIVTSDTFQSR